VPRPAVARVRQTADRFLRVAGPPARTVRDRVTREVGERLGRRLGRGVQDVAPQRAPEPPTGEPSSPAAPNPASIARNVAHERPRAQQPTAARRDPEAGPGAKLPPRRPRPA
jgi:hypothetical protein